MSFNLDGLRVFLSGPMSGIEDWNRAAFAKTSAWCMEHGAIEVFDPSGGAPKGPDSHSHEHWMRQTLHELTRWENGTRYEDNRPHYDVLLLLDGWKSSKGAMAEVNAAVACGIECVTLRNAVMWAKEDGDD